MAREQHYFISETDNLVPVLVMLLQGAPAGAGFTVHSGGDVLITCTKEENVGFTLTTDHPDVQQLLELLRLIMKQAKA